MKSKENDVRMTCCMYFDFAVALVKAKITNMRTYYNKELAKVKDSMKRGAGAEGIYKSKWVHFENLDSFLRDQVVARRPLSNLVCMYLHLLFYSVYTIWNTCKQNFII